MPFRSLVTRELSELFGVLAHPMRLRLLEELGNDEKDVKSLSEILSLSQPTVSQHLSVLRTHRLVVERKEGRRVFYRLRSPALAAWALEGITFVVPDRQQVDEFLSAIEKARDAWASEGRPRRNMQARKEQR